LHKGLRVLENIVKPLKPWALPGNVDIEITNFCQLQCDMCPRQGFKKERKLGKMSAEQFRHVLSELKGVPCLSFSGNGEATMHPQFMEFFRMAREAQKKLTISTNGLGFMKLSREDLTEIVKGFHAIDISMDSPYKGKYEDIRKGAFFDELIEGIKRLAKVNDMGSALISLHLVYIDQKRKELEDMVELVKDLGLNKITIGKLMSYQGSAVKEKRAISADDMKNFKKFASQKSIDISFNFYKNFSLGKKIAGCNWPWRYAFISYEGIVTPCCSIKDPTRINLGNIFEQNFKDIWRGEKFVAFRKNIKKGCFPRICRDTRCWFVDRDFGHEIG